MGRFWKFWVRWKGNEEADNMIMYSWWLGKGLVLENEKYDSNVFFKNLGNGLTEWDDFGVVGKAIQIYNEWHIKYFRRENKQFCLNQISIHVTTTYISRNPWYPHFSLLTPGKSVFWGYFCKNWPYSCREWLLKQFASNLS
jgi:hypothetical protein